MPRRNKGAFLKGIAKVEVEVAAAVAETLTVIERNLKDPESPTAAPYRTGALRRSYHQTHPEPLSGKVGNDAGIAPYAVFLEFGTSRMAARPHLIPSAERERGSFKEKVAAALIEGLRGYGGGKRSEMVAPVHTVARGPIQGGDET